MTYRKYRLLAWTCLLAVVLAVACSKKPTQSPTPTPGTTPLGVTPAQAPPGARVVITGLTLDVASEYTIFFADMQSLLSSDSNGTVYAVVPLFYDSVSAWHVPPAGPVDVVVHRNGVPFSSATAAFTVQALAEAPGTVRSIATSYQVANQSYKTVLNVLAPEPGLQQQFAFAISSAIDNNPYLVGDSALSALLDSLEQNDPQGLKLIDAIYGTSGAAAELEEWSNALQAMAAGIVAARVSASASSAGISDNDLAMMMQYSTVLKLFGETYVHGAAESASEIAFVGGWLSFLGVIPGPFQGVAAFVGFLNVILSLQDLVINKIIVAALPTRIDSLVVNLADTTINIHEITDSELRIYVSNQPDSVITVGDLADQFFNIIGLAVPNAESLREMILEAVYFTIGQIKTYLKDYHTAHPEFGYDPDIFDLPSIPTISWEAELTDLRLIELSTFTPNLLDPLEDQLNWQSTGDYGEGKIRIYPSSDDDAIIIVLPPLFSYSGTAFGTDGASASEVVSVHIQPDMVLEVEFAEVISPEGSNALGVRVGYLNSAGIPVWQPNLSVSLSTDGGGSDPSVGVTDADGKFVSLVSLNPFSDMVTVGVTVTGAGGAQVATTVQAAVQTVAEKFVEISMPDVFPVGVATQVTIRAGIRTNGVASYMQGVPINVNMNQGETSISSGITNSAGTFITTVTLLEDENSVEFTARAQFPDFEFVSAEGRALRPNEIVLYGRKAKVGANWNLDGLRKQEEHVGYDFDNYDSSITLLRSYTSGPLTSSVSLTSTNQSSVLLSENQFSGAQFSSSMTGQLTVTGSDSLYSFSGAANTQFRVRFDVWGEPAQYDLSINYVASRNFRIQTPLVECNQGEPCDAINESGFLEAGQRYLINVSMYDFVQISDPPCEGCSSTGSESFNSSATLTLSVQH